MKSPGKEKIERRFLCFAHGRDSAWEAICLDLDLAVQGSSFDEVRELLSESISTYLQDALKEDERNATRLLNRRAPLGVRLRYLFGWIVHVLKDRRQQDEYQASFEIPCRA